jgi:signal transduction histidine kinase
VKFTPPGGRIEVRSLVEPWHEGLAAGIAVADTGPGIASRDLEHIFERFFQGTRADTKHVTGAGLGLAIVKNLVEAHGGTVTVKSSKGHGSTFSVLFPVAQLVEIESAVAG